MPDDVARLPWSEDQWAAVRRAVQEAAGKARVASSFLPLAGPLPPGQASVPGLGMNEEDVPGGGGNQRLKIDDGDTLKLTTLSCEVHLTTQQAEDPELASAKQMLGRAADLIGRLEDAIIFNGQPDAHEAPKLTRNGEEHLVVTPAVYKVQGGRQDSGLLGDESFHAEHPELVKKVRRHGSAGYGADLVTKVGEAIQSLERRGHYGPFACVLGHELFQDAITPHVGSLVLATDRIIPLLDGGPLRRSSVLPHDHGVVVALGGSPIDLVVGSDVHVKFLQVTLEPRYVLRVSERFVLRLKQPTARCRLEGEVNLGGGARPAGDAVEQIAASLDELGARIAAFVNEMRAWVAAPTDGPSGSDT